MRISKQVQMLRDYRWNGFLLADFWGRRFPREALLCAKSGSSAGWIFPGVQLAAVPAGLKDKIRSGLRKG